MITPDHANETVVLLHGLGRTRRCWWLLRRRLERAGYRTEAWTYPSLSQPIESLARFCRARLQPIECDPTVTRLHFVTHSLGGIILRQMLEADSQPGAAGPHGWRDKLGRIIMLAPPNRGSAWARRLGPVLRWFSGGGHLARLLFLPTRETKDQAGRMPAPLAPALVQLSDEPASFVNRLGSAQGDSASADWVSRVAVIAAAKDGKCPLATTYLPGCEPGASKASHFVVPGRHTFIMYRRDTCELVLRVLKS